MSYILSILGENNENGNTIIAFNLAYLLKQNNKRVLLISPSHSLSDFSFLEPKTISNDLVMSPFTIFTLYKNVQVLSLKNIQKDILNWDKVFVDQINKFKKYFDFIICVCSQEVASKIDVILCESNEVMGVFDANNVSINTVINLSSSIRCVQKSNINLKNFTILLNMLDSSNHNHLEHMLQINKFCRKFCTFVTLPYHRLLVTLNKESISFAKNLAWEDYSISLNKIVDLLLKKN